MLHKKNSNNKINANFIYRYYTENKRNFHFINCCFNKKQQQSTETTEQVTTTNVEHCLYEEVLGTESGRIIQFLLLIYFETDG